MNWSANDRSRPNPNRHGDRRTPMPVPHLTDADADRLLTGQGAPPPGTERIAAVLAAARRPADPSDLGGENAARQAFRAARHRVSSEPAAPGTGISAVGAKSRTRPARRHLALAGLIVGVVVSATGAQALTTLLRPDADQPAPTRSTATQPPSPVPSGQAPTGPSTLTPSTPAADTSPKPTIAELCRAYQALSPTQADDALETAKYRPLAALGDNRQEINRYCTLQDTSPPGSPTAVRPSSPANPTTPTKTATRPPAQPGNAVEAQGGTVTVKCTGTTATVQHVEPAAGYSLKDYDPGPADEVQIVLISSTNESEIKIKCDSGKPVPAIKESPQ